ncbi:type IV secretory system conjugative DNA transfer family protein, partial [Xanthomonas sp. MUS 060]|uniref:type IV secretory system conjugative DNA transfer family protein n=1 Tax=Xanthomonas sp. MUS 060 TaxID=1588031 RepID=UPI0005F2D030
AARKAAATTSTTPKGAQGSSYNINYTEEKRALRCYSSKDASRSAARLLFLEGCKPIRCKKNWFFKDSFFKQRIRPPVEIAKMGAAPDKPPEAS